jgi:CRISPR-associated endonuclease/helicase Cas3
MKDSYNSTFYAHTAPDENGKPLPEESCTWQPLADHLRSVAALGKQFAAPLGLEKEAALAGLLHDLGKYRDEFQSYLRGERSGGADTQHAVYGAAWAWAKEQLGAAFGIAGHPTGLRDLADLRSAVEKPALRVANSLPVLEQRFIAELGTLPKPPGCPPHVKTKHAVEFYTRLLFSCVGDADRLDTAIWPAKVAPDRPLEAAKLLELVVAERERKRATVPDGPVARARNRIFDAGLLAANGATIRSPGSRGPGAD